MTGYSVKSTMVQTLTQLNITNGIWCGDDQVISANISIWSGDDLLLGPEVVMT